MKKMKKLLMYAVVLLSFIQTIQSQSVKDGLRYLEIEQFKNARKVFSDLATKSPTAEHYYYLGYFYLQNQQTDSAKIFFEKGIQKEPKYALNHVGLGTVTFLKGDKGAAKKQFEDAIALGKGKDFNVIYRAAEAYTDYEVKDANEAIKLLEPIKEKKGFTPEMSLVLGDAYNEKNDLTKTVEAYNQAIYYTQNKSPKVITRSANSMIRVRNYQEAVNRLDQAIALDASYSPAYRRLADVYYLFGKYPKAIENLKKYKQFSDGDIESDFRYAKALFNNKDYAESLKELDKLDGKINTPVYYRLKAYTQTEAKDCENAKKNIETFFAKATPAQILPSDYEYYGKIYLCQKQEPEGLAQLLKAADLDTTKNGLIIRKQVADTLAKRDKYTEAITQYEIIVSKAAPKDSFKMANAYFDLGISHYYDKKFSKSDSVFGKMLEYSPKYATGYLLRGRSNAKLEADKMTGRAKPYYEEFLKLTEEAVNKAAEKDKEKETNKYKAGRKESYQYLMTSAYIVDRNLAKAKVNAKKVLELDPKDSQALSIEKAQTLAPVTNSPKVAPKTVPKTK
jgi:tetratricopeptide (TPR) repeat protein